jgi:hypothetical protein
MGKNKNEHWRIIIADTECPFRESLDKVLSNEICFCKKITDPEANPYCSFTNCRLKEV